MAINLRLPPELDAALRRALFDYRERPTASVERSKLKPPRRPYERPSVLLKLPEGMNSLDLLDREDRI
jgi:hypothetical protein